MELLTLSFTAVAFVYTKRLGEGDHCQNGKYKIKFMFVISAHQTMYRVHKDMKQITVSNHEEKYIRRKKNDKNWLPVNDRSIFFFFFFFFIIWGQALLIETGLNNLILPSFDKIFSRLLQNVNYYFTWRHIKDFMLKNLELRLQLCPKDTTWHINLTPFSAFYYPPCCANLKYICWYCL